MSGGSWDYVYWKVEEAARRLQQEKCPYRRALGDRLELCARALHDIEWVDSSDMGSGDDIEAIKSALGPDAKALVLERLKGDALDVMRQMQVLMELI